MPASAERCADPARRRLLAALPAGAALLPVAALATQTNAPPPAVMAPPRYTSRSVVLMGDMVMPTALERARHLLHLVERMPEARDAYLQGGAVEALEARFATLLGKSAAAFIPTGTLANHLALRVLCGDRRHAIVQYESHVYRDESDTVPILSSMQLLPLARGRAAPTLDEVAQAIDDAERGPYPIAVGAISLESPVRRADGAMLPFDLVRDIAKLARSKDIGLHLDGARLLLGSGLPGFDVQAYSALFDTVYVSLYKYLGAPFGAILAGDAATIAKVRAQRHVFGSTVFQGWQAALPALDALEGFQARFAQARMRAEALFAGLAEAGGYTIRPVAHGSNIVFVELAPERAQGFRERLRSADIHVREPKDGRVQMDFNESLLRRDVAGVVAAFAAA